MCYCPGAEALRCAWAGQAAGDTGEANQALSRAVWLLGGLHLRVHFINEGDRQSWPPRLLDILAQAGNSQALSRLNFSSNWEERGWRGWPLPLNSQVCEGSGWLWTAGIYTPLPLYPQRAPPQSRCIILSRCWLGPKLLALRGRCSLWQLHRLPPFGRRGFRDFPLGDEHEGVS